MATRGDPSTRIRASRAGRGPDLTQPISRSRDVLDDYQALTLTSDQWLHVTVQRVDGIHPHDLDPGRRADLCAALREELAAVAPFELTAGPVLAGDSAAVLDLDGDLPGQPWTRLTERVCAAITTVLGPDAAASRPGPPHLSLGYATAELDSGALQSRLRRKVRPARAAFPVTAVHLVDVEQDPGAATYRWQTWDRIDLTA